ncbi:wall-associated receptor kinase-like 10 [Arachis ipaensis]|uniref:wall-associated receptor kinase-like 10 n=1 Tax=Arachis ipaensis TaxID=130454 RepID=UPI000A2B7C4C|nr:wall-associated receptor kinase-like 10 [Arachis ipaensis]
MTTMVMLRFLFHIIIIMHLLLASGKLDLQFLHDPIMAQPGCDLTCGDVEIPYPFGMKDPKCYAEEWFQIECKSNHTPYLKLINLEVTAIDVNISTVEVKNPVFHRKCHDGGRDSSLSRPKPTIEDPAGISLRGSPFVYSNKRNTFVAFGCNILGFLHSNRSVVAGCVSVCGPKEFTRLKKLVASGKKVNLGCHGKFCCVASIPSHLSEYEVTMEDIRNGSIAPGCDDYALIAKKWREELTWMVNQKESELKKNVSHYAHAVLEFEILNWINIEATNAECLKTNVTSSKMEHSGWRCKCRVGFHGNPYIAGGCVVIRDRWYHSEGTPTKELMVVYLLLCDKCIGLLSSLGSIILLLGLRWLYEVERKRIAKKSRESFFKKNGGVLLEKVLSSSEGSFDKFKLFSLKELEKATNHFNVNRILGNGGEGTVYKGMLLDGKIVAVKKFKVQGKIEQFINEFAILSQIDHRNVVKLLGCCLETEIPLLVYEFIPNGTLFQYLHDQDAYLPMTWEMRLKIAIEVAGALFYLHSAASKPIYHRDIKSTNILLDEKYNAKVADFGTSKMIAIEDTHLTTLVKGTFGYLDPEYFHTSQFTDKSDVYSFGVVLVELLTGQKPVSFVAPDEAQNLASYFILCMEEKRVFDIIDKRIMWEGRRKHINAVAKLAKRCLDLKGIKRPSMKEVSMQLYGIWELQRNSRA